MRYEIPSAVLAKTTQCPHGMNCLDSEMCGKESLCEIDRVVGPTMAFVKKACITCGYYLLYGNSHVCTCPTRIALHRGHGV